ncbi:MAG: sigma-54 dependent transcriptional regulator [Deltaproteobacteria bacterium]|nr:sigma-54 dependent transcriptional regulator [Deltaproteobacteria bacterium]
MSKKIHILVVDDETAMRECLRDWLLEDGYEVGLAASGPEAIAMARDYPWHVVLLDLKMPGMDGLQTLAELRQVAPNAEVVMMTAYATVDTAVQAMKSGAFDYLVKPFDPEEVELLIKKVVSHQELVLENILLRRRLEEREEFDEIIGQSQPMLDLFETLSRVAPADSTVLITGESGTGKELVARAIHGNSPRCYHPFITVSCGALPDSLLESELFGHEKGAFTGADQIRKGRIEMANGGTLFLDEIGEISAKTQVDLLRVLQEKKIQRLGSEEEIPVEVRILAATNRDLLKAIGEQRFREDLYYRLNVISIHLPPLRQRKEDIPILAESFIRKFCLEMNKDLVTIGPEAMQLLTSYHWPGNVRELENIIERALVIGTGKAIVPGDLPFGQGQIQEAEMPESIQEMERLHIKRILNNTAWNISQSARRLGIDRQTLYNKMQKYGLSRDK